MTNETLLNKQFIFDSLGGSVPWLRSLKYLQDFIFSYIQPWVACLTFVLNLTVFLLCIAIYIKTKRKNHKPAFLYIGVLAAFDMVVGMFNIHNFASVRVSLEELKVQNYCTTGWPIFVFMQFSSILTLVVLTVDRYIFIKKPLHYPLIMTPYRSWMMLFAGIFGGLLLGILAGFTIKEPSDYINIQLCTWVHFFPGWLQITMEINYILALSTIICIYSVVLSQFRKSRKRLEALQKTSREEDFTKSNIIFQQKRGLFTKELFPEQSKEAVQTLSVRKSDGEKCFTQEYQSRKRRNSSVVKKISFLVSHARAATYILALVITLWITFTPFCVFSLYEAISHIAQPEPMLQNSTVNGTLAFMCLKTALEHKECMDIKIEDYEIHEYKERLKTIAHVEETAYFEYIIGVLFPLINAMLNPCLYALWYSEFRTYLVQIPHWFKKKKQQPDDFKFEIQIVKI